MWRAARLGAARWERGRHGEHRALESERQARDGENQEARSSSPTLGRASRGEKERVTTSTSCTGPFQGRSYPVSLARKLLL